MGTQNYDPLGNLWLSTAAAAFPIVLLMALLATGRVSAPKAALAGLLAALLLAMFLYAPELLTRWTVRVAVPLYVAGLASRRFAPRWSRLAWTAGCGFYLLHVACAFQYYHHWSHAEAYASTAQQTAEVVGLDWGGGLYFNYAFTLVWLADVGWWWAGVESYSARPRWLDWAVHAYLGFIAFNATIVFATGFSRWFGIAACVLLAGVWMVCRSRGARAAAK